MYLHSHLSGSVQIFNLRIYQRAESKEHVCCRSSRPVHEQQQQQGSEEEQDDGPSEAFAAFMQVVQQVMLAGHTCNDVSQCCVHALTSASAVSCIQHLSAVGDLRQRAYRALGHTLCCRLAAVITCKEYRRDL